MMMGTQLLACCLLVSLVTVGNGASLKWRKAEPLTSVVCSGPGDPFPNPDDCGSFLQCEPSGVAVVKKCPANLEFNADLKVCDHPENAGCSSSSSDSSDSSSSDSSSSEEGNGDDSSSEDLIAKVNAGRKLHVPELIPNAFPLHA